MIFFILPVALYLVIIFLIPILWRIIGASFKESDSKIKQLTLIVPFRNESENLGDLLKSIEGLKTNIHLKYIFVNDHSEDNGADLVKNWVKEKEGSALLIDLPQGCNGKKAALNIAMDHVDTEWVWQLDADTSFNPNVLELLEYAANSNQKLILAPVIVKANKKAYKNQFQIFENIVLQFITSLFAQINSAFLANGANLFYTKSVFKDYQKQNVGANFASGDDLFLLFFIKNTFGNAAITYLNHPQSIVYTNVIQDKKSFWNQKIRWSAKMNTNYLKVPLLVIFFILLLFCIPILFIIALFFIPLKIVLGFLFLKFLVEIFVFSNILSFFKTLGNIVVFPFFVLLYPFYSLKVYFTAQNKSFVWKERVYPK
jgi:glycosyltransferase involved in cell wall biosynthesis